MRGIPEPPKRELPGFSTRIFLRALVFIAVGMVGVGIMSLDYIQRGTTFSIGLGVMIAGVFLAAAAWLYTMSHVVCPQCTRKKLPRWKPSDEPGAPYHYYCGKCHVVWETGVRNAEEHDSSHD